MQKPIYFDYLATTPVDPRVVEKMVHCLSMEGILVTPHPVPTSMGGKRKRPLKTHDAKSPT